MANLTPMMRQYLETKEKYPGMILFFRLGDFYEMFFDDAKLVSRELELTLTGKSCGMEERAPMCGVPFHSAETYINRLIEKGYKVAICEQMEDPATAKGLVRRDVVRVVTPGTVIEQSMLEERRNSYILSVCLEGHRAGLAFADVSTGEFYLYDIDKAEVRLQDELLRIAPKEIIANAELPKGATPLPVDIVSSNDYQLSKAKTALSEHFSVQSLDALGISSMRLGVRAAGALMKYLSETQKNALQHMTKIAPYHDSKYMMLDHTARRNLELTESMRTRQKKGSLLGILDYTATAMGGRMLRSFIEQPLAEKADIDKRLQSVTRLVKADMAIDMIREQLTDVYDIERLLSKISYQTINAKDCLALCNSLSCVPFIRDALCEIADTEQLRELHEMMEPLDDVSDLLRRAISPDAPAIMSDGHYIKAGYNAELDKLREASRNGEQWIADLEAKERELTGIKNLRIQFNKVFGFYIEVTKSNYDLVPYRYTRKQTLANSERYMTAELHEIEETVLGAKEKSVRLEQALFMELRDYLSAQIPRIQRTAAALKTLDALISLAVAAVRNHYVCPSITEDGVIRIENGRHPVVEDGLGSDEQFVPNSTMMDNQDNRMLIITGPNMAGKSTYMRQVALITLMAHMGSFVPADSASISTVDRIFTRVGASDDLASGQSTFMVEMNEMAHILRSATSRSLIVLDEIGRGTSTFDGLSIAWAVVEYLVDAKRIGAKTLFATHYHELSELEGRLSGVVNYRISVKEHGEDVIFLRKIERGGADKSFGIHVAHLAGLPRPVIMRAHEILARIEANDVNQSSIGQNILGTDEERLPQQVGLFESPAMDLIEELRSIDVMAMTPIDALNTLFSLKEKARRI
ncbi:MAG: DNA mismatch repair protein MutS [Clostridia bacterium]|nr:DNA mismatch repair protein MutS [Clostridia bacterium]